MEPTIRIEHQYLNHAYTKRLYWETNSYDYTFEEAVTARDKYLELWHSIDKTFESVTMYIVYKK